MLGQPAIRRQDRHARRHAYLQPASDGIPPITGVRWRASRHPSVASDCDPCCFVTVLVASALFNAHRTPATRFRSQPCSWPRIRAKCPCRSLGRLSPATLLARLVTLEIEGEPRRGGLEAGLCCPRCQCS